MNTANHTAWRTKADGSTWYVDWIGNGQQQGDRYSYTLEESKAKPMTEAQCRAFCAYMKECETVGFWC
jgi:hypothetical protein